jgi:DNA helicase II / ATP-dependent DNA helicase PcrA
VSDVETLAPISVGADQIERLLADLNPPQRKAVEHGEGPLLVIAGAGSGKTRVLTRRVAYLVATGQARPSEILAITFTNKAAGEMRERVEQLVGGVSKLMWVMTFHSACARILRANAERLGYKRSFTIYDEADSLRMLKRCMEESEIDPKRFTPRSIRAAISSAKNRLEDSTDYAERQGSYFEEQVATAYALYERRMVEASAMDFDDLLVRTVNLLELFEDVRERYQRTFRWILVDEYQDTNRAQYRLLQLLAGEQRNLTVVGDDAQSIYSFRSADVRNILEFEQDFGGAEVVKLEQNYRSTGTILDAANAVISNNVEQKPKNLWTDEGRGEPVTIAELDDEHAEARYVAGEIERLVSDEGYARDDVAVFYRMNAQSRVLEDTLVRYDMPYQVIGGTKFYERAEIKDAVAYLQLLANPADAISFGRVVNSPRRGIGQQTQARVLSHANTTGADVWDVLARPHEIPAVGTAAVKALSRFAAIMAGLRERADSDSVAQLLESVLHDTGYMEALEAERTLEAEGRIENLQELVGVAREFDVNREVEGPLNESRLNDAGAPLRPSDSASQDTPLEEFLARISLYTEQDSIRDAESLITLMTLHNAKGLEYEAVFMIGCEEGVFPHARSVEEGNLEEERRLAYVGVTRARKRLYMACARRRTLHGAGGWNLPSRFLREVPEELTEHKAMAIRTGWQSGPGAGGGLPAGGGFAAPERKQPHEPEAEFQIGDDVIHASFGEGVVTSVEPGSVIVVRFAAEGAERKLMADYAPLKKAS